MTAVPRSNFGTGEARDGKSFDEWLAEDKAKNPYAYQIPWWIKLSSAPNSQDRKD